MKKLAMIALAAVATFAATSCGGEEKKANDEAAAAAVQDGNKFETEKYSITYPKEWKETSTFQNTINAESADGEMKLIANCDDGGPTIAQLGEYANNLKAFHQSGKVEDPVINDKTMTMKAVDPDKVEIHFAVMKEDKVGVIGSIKCPEAKAGEAETILQGIMNSIQFK